MKVLIATGLYPPEIGGPATYTALLEKELPKHGHTVKVLPFSTSRHLPRGIRHVHYFFQLLIKARGVHIIFAQDVASVGLPALLAARVIGKKFFVRVPGDYAWEQATQRYGVTETIDEFQKKKYGRNIEFLRSVQTFVTKYSDVTITPSDYFKNLVTVWGVNPNKVVTIYNGVDLNIKPIAVEKPAPLTIVTAGRLVPWKGFVELITLMEQLPSWHLVILGDGPQRSELVALIKEKKLEARVHLKGVVIREEVFGWCTVADAFVLNTKFESFSFQIVEAMAAGVPVITTKVGSLPELITSPTEGLLLQPNDFNGFLEAIKSVLTEKAAWQERVRMAEQKAQTFSIEKTVEALCVVMEEKV